MDTGATTPRRIVVTGAAGMVGSHVTEVLLGRGDSVVAIDNFLTGSEAWPSWTPT